MFHEATPSDLHLLTEWRWLVGDRPRLYGWSTAGDLFLLNAEGQVLMLDPGAGTAEIVADSIPAFRSLLDDEDRSVELLQLGVVEAYEAANGPLAHRRCLSFTTLPVFGGAYTIDNRYCLSIEEHAGVTGHVHRQIRDLPDGARIELKIVP